MCVSCWTVWRCRGEGVTRSCGRERRQRHAGGGRKTTVDLAPVRTSTGVFITNSSIRSRYTRVSTCFKSELPLTIATKNTKLP